MIAGALLLQALELTAWLGLYRKVKSETRRQILTFGHPKPSKIPLLDARLKKWSGYPTKPRAFAAKRAISMARRLVNTRAFEYLMVGITNPRSKMHQQLVKKRKKQSVHLFV